MEYNINLTNPEDNPNGFICTHLAEFEYGNEAIEAVSLTKYVTDFNDLHGDDGISVVLMECGTRFLVTEPSVSHFLKTNYDQSFSGLESTENAGLHSSLISAHRAFVHEIRSNPLRRFKQYVLKLPYGYKCQLGFMNPTTVRRLKGSMNVAETTLIHQKTRLAEDMDFEHGTVTYVCALLKDQKKVIRNEIEENHEFNDFFDRLHVSAFSPGKSRGSGFHSSRNTVGGHLYRGSGTGGGRGSGLHLGGGNETGLGRGSGDKTPPGSAGGSTDAVGGSFGGINFGTTNSSKRRGLFGNTYF
jgi:hypothetical protein